MVQDHSDHSDPFNGLATGVSDGDMHSSKRLSWDDADQSAARNLKYKKRDHYAPTRDF